MRIATGPTGPVMVCIRMLGNPNGADMRCIDCTEPATHRRRCETHHTKSTRDARPSAPDEHGADDERPGTMLRHGFGDVSTSGARPGATGA